MGKLSNLTQRRGKVLAAVKESTAGGLDLRRRVSALEAEVQECRQLNLRLAELTDLVTELLLPDEQRDEAKMQELLRRYQQSL
jgi:flagellar biosynthesis/type III secretory pathway chaperone